MRVVCHKTGGANSATGESVSLSETRVSHSAQTGSHFLMPPARRSTGQGQWALGHLEPLTPQERMKKDDDGLHVRARIETIYARDGFNSIDPSDLRGRMRWWGLYTQRRPGISGGKTAILEPEELDDEYFMMRVRIPGGAMSGEQLRVVASIATEFGRDFADITDRQNV